MGPTQRLLVVVVAATLLACGGEASQARSPLPAASNNSAREVQPERSASGPAVAAEPRLGQSMPSWEVAAWANTAPLTLADLHGQVVVVRFWTDTCPFCEASMPALAGLAEQFADQPVTFVGLYHAKPRNRVGAWLAAQKVAKDWGVAFPIGHDADWATLRSWWLSTGDRSATSATIVLGTKGEVIHVHPGPVYFPSDDDQYAQQNQDFVALRDAISRGIVDGK